MICRNSDDLEVKKESYKAFILPLQQVLLYLSMISLDSLYIHVDRIILRKVMIYMIDCLLAYKQVFEVNNCEKEITHAKSCLIQVKKYQNRIGLLEKLWTENILPVLNNLEIQ
jgi:hypothetical protein